MPKQRITKEQVVEAAFEIARSGGMEQVLVKAIAQRLNCSVQPIYCYCKNMDGLRRDVVERVCRFVREYAAARVEPDDLFRSVGRAYVQLAKEEPQLFRIFILHRREGVSSLDELYRSETDPRVAEWIAARLNVPLPEARQLHLHMLVYTIGIGTIFSVTSPGIAADEIYAQQEAAYEAFLRQIPGLAGEGTER